MRLRKLALQDIAGMLEWMTDPDLQKNFRFDTSNATEEKAKAFIAHSFTENARHYAIVDDKDVYLGTISLKEIDKRDGTAEYAIALRKCAIGTGVAKSATEQLFSIARKELGLERIYLNVLEENKRARRFYEKMGFVYEGCFAGHIVIGGERHSLCWYGYLLNAGAGKTCSRQAKMVAFPQNGDQRGHLVVVEGQKDVPFFIKRVFYIYGSDADVVRGQHANRRTEFMLINVSGRSKVRVDYGDRTEVFSLDKAHTGLYIPKMVWKDMYDFSADSVLLVLASEAYDPSEYIRDKDQYYKEIGVNQ